MSNISFCEFCNKLTVSNNQLFHLGSKEPYVNSTCHECGKPKHDKIKEK